YGNAGNDLLNGQAGSDALFGGAGNDRLYGDLGDDRVWGGIGDDVLHGGAGTNRLLDAVGKNSFVAGTGDVFTLATRALTDEQLGRDGQLMVSLQDNALIFQGPSTGGFRLEGTWVSSVDAWKNEIFKATGP